MSAPACTCRPGVRCESCARRSRAVRRVMRVVPDSRWEHTDPVRYWDAYTAGCDARAALSIVCGADLDAINPARGTAPL